MTDIPTISPLALKTLHDKGQPVLLVDVRTPAEFQELRMPFAKLAPLHSLDPKTVVEDAGIGATDTIYLSCRTDTRSRMAARKFLQAGFGNVCIVAGGVEAWEAADLPVLRGRRVISLERQVRIAAGSLVLTGLILGYAVHPGFVGLSAFVGCGLVFAGVTDTCAMGMLLARMPWNQAGTETPKPLFAVTPDLTVHTTPDPPTVVGGKPASRLGSTPAPNPQ
jgi:rhodanese-related sulfurtransferase